MGRRRSLARVVGIFGAIAGAHLGAMGCGETAPEDADVAVQDAVAAVDVGPASTDTTDAGAVVADAGPLACDQAPAGTSCDDGEACTVDDRCAEGACVAGANVCQCHADGDCMAYEDGNLCNGSLYCDQKVFPWTCRLNPTTPVYCPPAKSVCMVASCNPATGECAEVAGPDGSPCNDGDACTVESACSKGGCVGSAASWCACKADAECADKDDGDLCSGSYYCDTQAFPHVCVIAPSSTVNCSASNDSACTKNACDPATGKCSPQPVETLQQICGSSGDLACRWLTLPDTAKPKEVGCDDGDPCSKNEVCADGTCGGGLDLCTCAKDADCAGQEDGDLCNGTLFCDLAKGKCLVNPKTVVSCPTVEDTECTKSVCNPLTGSCALAPVNSGKPCDDGDICTKDEFCKVGQCAEGENACVCKTDADCADKDDGDLCNGLLYCSKVNGACLPKDFSAVVCPTVGDTLCLKNTCAPLTGKCAPTAVKGQVPCDDDNKCTKGEICAKGECGGGTFVCTCGSDADCVDQDDGDLCNGIMFCNKALPAPVCEPNPGSKVSCPKAGDTDCLKKTCVPQTGKCAPQPVGTGNPCDDGDACSQSDWCLSGECKAGPDACECHVDADCAAKDDGNLCNGTMYCDKSEKMPKCKPDPGSVVWCPKGDDTACLKRVCAPKTGQCPLQPRPNGEPCPAGDPCVAKAVCLAGACTAAALTDCDDADPCTLDTCKSQLGCAHAPLACGDGNDCTADTCDAKTGKCGNDAAAMQGKNCNGDDSGCTVNDFCNLGSCVIGKSVLCPTAKDPCAESQCQSQGAAVHVCVEVPKADDSPCSDAHPCLLGATCKAGGCVPGKSEKLFRRERTLAGKQVRYSAAVAVAGGYLAAGGVRPAVGPGGASWLLERIALDGLPVAANAQLLTSAVADEGPGAVDMHVMAAGAVIAGSGRTAAEGAQVRVVAVAEDGKTLLWDRHHGGKGDEQAAALAPLAGGGWLVAGRIGSAESGDGLALRLSATGLLLATWFDPGAGMGGLNDGVGTNDGGALLVGWRTPAGGKQQAHLVRLDGGWKVVWSQLLGVATSQSLTAVARVGAATLAAGWKDAPTPHAWWLELDALGQTRWQQATTLPSQAAAMVPLGAGSFAVAGRMVGAVDSGWLAGLDGGGHLFWQREDAQGGDERLTGLVLTPDGGLLAAGYVAVKGSERGLLLRLDSWGHGTCGSAGVCAGKKLTDCDDKKVCTDDLCDASQGCAPAHNTVGCDDGDACTTADACLAGGCIAGGKTSCDDGNTCTLDVCKPEAGCGHSAAAGATCDDGSVCTMKDTCVGATCTFQKKDCDDKQVCTLDACDPKAGCLHATKADETPCGGGKVCLLGTCTKRWAVAVQAGSSFTLAASPEGKVSSWGYAAYGTLGRTGKSDAPGEVVNLPASVTMTAGSTFGCVATATGQVYCWGSGPLGIGCGVPGQPVAVPVVKLTDTITQLEVSYSGRVCATTKAGLVRCWGANGWGACGIGVQGSPVCIPDKSVLELNDAVQAVTGGSHSCARNAIGKVRCWGNSFNGELGDGGAISHLNKTFKPRDVVGLVDAIDLSSSSNHLCAVRASGVVVCWGLNSSGQLGDGSLTTRSAPAKVFALSDAIAVDTGGAHSCALRKTGQVACWGGNTYGQLGTGNTFKSIAPLTVPGLAGVIAISAGDRHTCALRKNGEVKCWGSNSFGELGTGKAGGNALAPVAVLGSTP